MNFLKKVGLSALSTVSNVVTTFTLNKLFALYFGPSGIAILSHLQNLISIMISVPLEGINRGLVKTLSGTVISSKEYSAFLSAALFLLAIVYLLSVPFLYFLVFQVPGIIGNLDATKFFLLAIVAFLLQFLYLFLLSLLQASQDLRHYSFWNIFNNCCGLLLVLWGLQQDLATGCMTLLFSSSISTLFVVYIVIHKKLLPRKLRKFRIIHVKELSGFILISLSVLIFGRLVDYFVRVLVIKNYSIIETGYWQTAVKLSDGYTNIIMGILTLTFFPVISSYINQKLSFKIFYHQFYYQYLAAIILFLLLVNIFSAEIIPFLFDENFMPSVRYFRFQTAGDFFKFLSWLPVFVIMAQGNTFTYIALQFFSALLYIVILWLATSYTGIIGVSYAHVIRYILFFAITLYTGSRMFKENLQ